MQAFLSSAKIACSLLSTFLGHVCLETHTHTHPVRTLALQALMLASVLGARQLDVSVARAQRRQLGLCEECGGLFDPAICAQQGCPTKQGLTGLPISTPKQRPMEDSGAKQPLNASAPVEWPKQQTLPQPNRQELQGEQLLQSREGRVEQTNRGQEATAREEKR